MPESRSKAHFRCVWREELKRIEMLKWSAALGDIPELGDIIEKLKGIMQRASEKLNKPDVCPKCADTLESGKTFFCAYREDCPENPFTNWQAHEDTPK